ncbi:AraC-like DNA-binding protein [Sagittula marina]|uniref:AraC-like DNA-binding protein n=1 Tax=Sagittula marina TaxID=943940 RepID=A0A7W6DZD4_9RHOB|nr:AraC family transcriptional regulator [Sagittula marina]MBB3988109.1 AraC-like DNA-binding protein [Sagittula marina]
MAVDWIIDSPFKAFSDVIPDAVVGSMADIGMVRLTDFVSVLQRARSMTLDGSLFWNVGAQYDLANLGPAGQAILAAPTLGDSLMALQRVFPLIQSGALLSVVPQGSVVEVTYRVLDPNIWPRQADAELTMGLIFGIVRHYLPDVASIMDLRFEHAPDAAGERLKRQLGCPVASNEICNTMFLPLSALDSRAEPAAAQNGQISGDMETSLSEALRGLRASQSTADRCRTEILSRLGREPLDQADIATELKLSDRSLRLQLQSERTSYRRVVDKCRAETSTLLLQKTDLPLAEIAWRLGYSEHSAFTRAARRWFGMTPEAIRLQA